MTQSVEQILDTIVRLQLVSSKDLEAIRSRWFRPGRDGVSDPGKFRQWLTTNHFLRQFVLDAIAAGKADTLALNQYRVRDQILTGPLAGAYHATDPLNRPVVIQVISRAVTEDPARKEQLIRIIQHGIQLHHPNVCRVLELGQANGLYYLVREYNEAASLADILNRRQKLAYDQSARIFALAAEGLRALHEHGIPGGKLTPDCILLATTGKSGGRPQRTVQILVAAVRQDIFDTRAIGVPPQQDLGGIPDDVPLLSLTTDASSPQPTTPKEDILRLGCLFYRCLAGTDPYPVDLLPNPPHRAPSLAAAAPNVPESLVEIVEEMIDPDPEKRPKSAAHVAKAIRVFLRAEEEDREIREEEQVILPKAADPRKAAMADYDEVVETVVEEEVEEDPKPQRKARKRPSLVNKESMGQIKQLIEELRPEPREWLFVGIGAAFMIILILLLELFSGIRFVHIVLLAAGASFSFLAEQVYRWWEDRQAQRQELGEG